MECGLVDMIQSYHVCMWVLMIIMAAGITAMMSKLAPPEEEHEDLRPKSEAEIIRLIDKLKAERKNDQDSAGNVTVRLRGRVGPTRKKGLK